MSISVGQKEETLESDEVTVKRMIAEVLKKQDEIFLKLGKILNNITGRPFPKKVEGRRARPDHNIPEKQPRPLHMSEGAKCSVHGYSNVGLSNALAGYDETRDDMANSYEEISKHIWMKIHQQHIQAIKQRILEKNFKPSRSFSNLEPEPPPI